MDGVVGVDARDGLEVIVFLDRDSVRAKLRAPETPHRWTDHPHSLPTEVEARLQGASVAITGKVFLRADLLARLPDLRAVMVAATGVDHVDIEACHARGIVVSNVRDYASTTVAEHVLMMMLSLRRNVFAYRESLRSGEWARSRHFYCLAHPIEDLRGSTLGIFGYGSIGAALTPLAEALGMRVLRAERRGRSPSRPGFVPFEEALAASDVVSLHVPLTTETRHMIGRAELSRMKPSALLINTGRGGLVDEGALDEALRTGTLAGAALDVLEGEPPRGDHPLVASARPNLLVTPHIAWASQAAMDRLAEQVVENIEAFARGTPRNVV